MAALYFPHGNHRATGSVPWPPPGYRFDHGRPALDFPAPDTGPIVRPTAHHKIVPLPIAPIGHHPDHGHAHHKIAIANPMEQAAPNTRHRDEPLPSPLSSPHGHRIPI
ncbi:hypothetical protein L3556_13900 [Candidatus Synechococcus calcipolaris G9]|uniref:Uncharacterized protein n=1 Tax=Candidatus Synechococcus calcipolaris G9 TaxID=1497997 RepID=A0ABT6F2F5_9SYNE|nr:hypothetical protein [Candidatus Synechococcus calcipolaris]MDG2992014.1 hypothetical protein [Candidatus Synechococcus calcipolaris G9]